jgi:hypothetical protein
MHIRFKRNLEPSYKKKPLIFVAQKKTREKFLFCKRFSILKVRDFGGITDLDRVFFLLLFCIPSLVSRNSSWPFLTVDVPQIKRTV